LLLLIFNFNQNIGAKKMSTYTIYTTKTCSYCVAAKNLLKSKGLEFKEVDLSNNNELRVEISEKWKWRTVPLILKDDELVGGFTDLSKKLSNE